MLWRTEASFKQVSSAMSSTLSNLGGFIFWMSSMGTNIRFPDSAISTSTSSLRSPLMPAATKPWVSWGTHTSLFWVHSACVAGSLKLFRSTDRYRSSGSFLSISTIAPNHARPLRYPNTGTEYHIKRSHRPTLHNTLLETTEMLVLPGSTTRTKWRFGLTRVTATVTSRRDGPVDARIHLLFEILYELFVVQLDGNYE